MLMNQEALLELVARGAPLATSLDALLRVIEQDAGDMLCTILLLDADGRHLSHGAAPSMPRSYLEAIDGAAIGPSAGSCGTAAYRREPVVVEDIATDPLWVDYRGLALAHGLRACWSTPIFSSSHALLGTFAMYYAEPGTPTPAHRRFVDLATLLAAIAIERDLAQAKLHESEHRYRRLLESDVIGVVIADGTGRLVEANETLLALIGYSAEELRTQSVRWRTVVPSEWMARESREPGDLAGRSTRAPFEIELLTRDGRRVPVLVTTASLDDAHGRRICLISELTALKQVEHALRASELRTKVLLAASGVGLWDSDLLTGSVYYSPEWKAQLGYADDELPNEHVVFEERLHPADATRVHTELHAYLSGDRAQYSLQFRMRHRSGDWRTIRAGAKVLRDASGKPTRIMGSHIDITEEQRAEEERRRVFERIADAFVAVDLEWNFVYVNQRAAEFFGRDVKALLGRNAWEAMPDAVGQPFHLTAVEAMRTQQPVQKELYATQFARWVECRIYPAPDGLSVYFQDITERKLADQEIRELNNELEERVRERTLQLEYANKQLESFSYSVSHDLRAPLRAINGFSEILVRRHGDSLNDEGQRYLGNIVTAGARMGRLIDDLLNYSKLGRRAVILQAVPLSDVMAHVATGAVERVQRAGGSVEIASDLPVVRGDWSLLSQLFGNLLENAATYHLPGAVPRVTVRWQREQDIAAITVADNGIGIPAEHHARIFAAFQRLQSDEDYPGTGIGLAVVARSAELLGGTVQLTSEVGAGSAFTVRLPLAGPSGAGAPAALATAP